MPRKSKRSARSYKKGGCGCGATSNYTLLKGGSPFGTSSIDTTMIGLDNTIPNYNTNIYSNDPLYTSISSRNVPNDFLKGGKTTMRKKRRSRKTKKALRKNKTTRNKKRGGNLLSTFIPIPASGIFGPGQVNPAPNVQPVTNISESNAPLI